VFQVVAGRNAKRRLRPKGRNHPWGRRRTEERGRRAKEAKEWSLNTGETLKDSPVFACLGINTEEVKGRALLEKQKCLCPLRAHTWHNHNTHELQSFPPK